MKKRLNKKVKGYAITFEVLITIASLALFINTTMYMMAAMNAQKYMNTVATATLIQGAKFGGFNNSVYIANELNRDPIGSAQTELNKKAGFLSPDSTAEGPIISGYTIGPTIDGKKYVDKVVVELEWKYPDFFGVFGGKRYKIKLKMDPIMRPGALLEDYGRD